MKKTLQKRFTLAEYFAESEKGKSKRIKKGRQSGLEMEVAPESDTLAEVEKSLL